MSSLYKSLDGGVSDYLVGATGITNYSLENPAVSITDPGVADILIDGSSGMSDAGYRVSPRTSLGIATVWQALTLISGDLAKLPIQLMGSDGDSESQIVGTPEYTAVAKLPNDRHSAFGFWRRMFVFALLYNNAYAWIRKDLLGNIRLWPLLPDRTSVDDQTGELFIHSEIDGVLYTFYPDEVLHLEGISLDNTEGYRFVTAARHAFGLALAQQGYSSKFYKSGGRVGGVLEVPAAMGKISQDTVEQGFRKTYESVDAAFKTFVARDGVKFVAAQHSPIDAQNVEARREVNRDVARYFNLHPSKLGEENKTSYGSKAEDNRDYLDTTLSPWITQRDGECDLKLLDRKDFINNRRWYTTNTDALLMLDALKRAQVYTLGRRGEWLTPNDVLRKEGMPLRDDEDGDDYSNPNTKSNNNKTAPDATSNGVDRAVKAHRDLFAMVLGAKLPIARNKIVKAVANPQRAPGWLQVSLGAVVDAVRPVCQSYAALVGVEPQHVEMMIHAELTRAVSQVLRDVSGQGDMQTISVELLSPEMSDEFVTELVERTINRIMGEPL